MKFVLNKAIIYLVICLLISFNFISANRNSQNLKVKTTAGEHVDILVASYNVGEQNPPTSVHSWLSSSKYSSKPDIYIIGLQEIVVLDIANIVLTSSKSKKQYDKWLAKLSQEVGPDYKLYRGDFLVGIAHYMFIKKSLEPKITKSREKNIKMGGIGPIELGNKGVISFGFKINSVSFSINVAHLAAHEKNASDRIKQLEETCESKYSIIEKKKIKEQDIVIITGDLNFRINNPATETKTIIERNEHLSLLPKDQLKIAFSDANSPASVKDLTEGEIRFKPTYKYDPKSTTTYDNGPKNRIPSWCDRVLFKKSSKISVLDYDRVEMTGSDHVPVRAILRVGV